MELSPSATSRRSSQGGHQVPSLSLKALLRYCQALHLGHQAGVRFLPLQLQLAEALLVLVELLPERRQQVLYSLLALLQLALCHLLAFLEPRAGQLEELRVVVLERLCRQLGECAGQLPLGLFPSDLTLCYQGALSLQLNVRFCKL